MKKNLALLLMVSCLVLMLGTFACAQNTSPSNSPTCAPADGGGRMNRGPGGGVMMEYMKKQFGLTDAQITQFMKLKEKRQAEAKTHREELSAKVRAILTPDQQAQYDLNKDRLVQKMKNRQGGAPGERGARAGEACKCGGHGDKACKEGAKGTCTCGGHGDKACKEGAKGACTCSGHGVQGQGQGMMKELFQGITLDNNQKDKLRTIMDGEKNRMKSMKSQMENDMKSILTAEQYKKFEAMKKNRGMKGRPGGGERPQHNDNK